MAVMTSMLVAGCGGSKTAKADTRKLTIVAHGGAKANLNVEIADDEPEREKGLSGRKHLDADGGMLFLLDNRHAGFWMKDTLIPLSVAFISRCGQIVFIDEMVPETLNVHNTPADYQFGLEANAGWFKRNGLDVGDEVQIPAELKQPGCA